MEPTVAMETISLADAKSRLPRLLDEVRTTHKRVAIVRDGRPEAVLIAVADLEALEETVDLLTSPGLVEQICQAESDLAAGAGVDADDVRRQLARRSQERC